MRDLGLRCLIVLLFTCGYASAQQAPVTILGPTTFNQGDLVHIDFVLFSCDPDENGEHEPLVIRASTGDIGNGVGALWDQYYVLGNLEFKATAGGTLSFLLAADSNPLFCAPSIPDESASVTVTVNHPRKHRFTLDQKLLLQVEANLDEVSAEETATYCLIVAPRDPACPELQKFASLEILQAAQIRLELAADPPDQDFMTIAQPAVILLPHISMQPGITQSEADAMNALTDSLCYSIALSRALITSINRAQSASDAGNTFWEGQQVQAINGYSALRAVVISGQPASLTNLQSALRAAGVPELFVTPTDALLFEAQIALHGLPAQISNVLTQMHTDGVTIDQIRGLMRVQDISLVSGTFPDLLTSPTLITALQRSSNSFVSPFASFKGTLEGHSRGNHEGGELEIMEKRFEINANFTLGAQSHGINPPTEPVGMQVGNYFTTIPPGSFQQHDEDQVDKDENGPFGSHKKAKFRFRGNINSVELDISIESIDGSSFQFRAKGEGADIGSTTPSIPVGLSIGNDGGSTNASAAGSD